MNYDKLLHLDWWQGLTATDRFPLMRKYEVKQVNNKLIYRVWIAENNKN